MIEFSPLKNQDCKGNIFLLSFQGRNLEKATLTASRTRADQAHTGKKNKKEAFSQRCVNSEDEGWIDD